MCRKQAPCEYVSSQKKEFGFDLVHFKSNGAFPDMLIAWLRGFRVGVKMNWIVHDSVTSWVDCLMSSAEAENGRNTLRVYFSLYVWLKVKLRKRKVSILFLYSFILLLLSNWNSGGFKHHVSIILCLLEGGHVFQVFFNSFICFIVCFMALRFTFLFCSFSHLYYLCDSCISFCSKVAICRETVLFPSTCREW